MKLNDQSPMPFGKHEDEKMESVPAEYLLWLWDECDFWRPDAIPSHHTKRLAVRDYIKRNLSALESECPDRILTHRP